jgi:nitrogen fixation-related uncharacterized protein
VRGPEMYISLVGVLIVILVVVLIVFLWRRR